jgi:hypothetical protein
MSGVRVTCGSLIRLLRTPEESAIGRFSALWKITSAYNLCQQDFQWNWIFFSSLLAEMKVGGTHVEVNELEHLSPTVPTLRMIIRGRGLLHQQTWLAQSIYNVRDLN